MNTRGLPVFMAALLLLSGCGSVTSDQQGSMSPTLQPETEQEPPPTPTEVQTESSLTTSTDSDSPVRIRIGTLRFNATQTYLRVTFLLDGEVRTVPVSVLNKSQSQASHCYQPPIYRQFDVECHTNTTDLVTGQVGRRSAGVTLTVAKNASPLDVESTLAHEFVHSHQSYREIRPGTIANISSVDQRIASRGVLEGQAAYINEIYNNRYLNNRSTGEYERYKNVHGYYQTGVYYFGMKYFQQRVSSPAESWSVFDSPPNTTEQLIHGLRPTEEPPAELTLNVTAEEQWRVVSRDRLGELPIRNLLRTRVSEEKAARATAGWGNDRFIRVTNRGQDGYVWVLPWDTASDADEFQTVFSQFMNQTVERQCQSLWEKDGMQYRVRQIDGQTTAITITPSSLNSNFTTDGNRTTVSLSTSEERASVCN